MGSTTPLFSWAFDAGVECSDFYPGHCTGVRHYAGVPAGNYSVTARYVGPFDPASYAVGPVTILPASTSTTISVSPGSPTPYGQDLVVNSSVVPDLAPRTDLGAQKPTGGISLYDGDTLLETKTLDSGSSAGFVVRGVDAGAHLFSVRYNGDGNYQPSESPRSSHLVNKLGTTTSLSSAPNPSEYSQDVAFTAEVRGPFSSFPTPTGTVDFFAGNDLLATVPVVDGRAEFSTTVLGVGQHVMEARYNGETNYTGSSVTGSQLVTKATSAVELTSSPSPSTWGAAVMLTARLSPGGNTGAITFFDGDSELGTVDLELGGDAGSVATLVTPTLAVGEHELHATYAGDDSHSPAAGTTRHTVNKATLTIAASDSRSTYGQSPPAITPSYLGFVNGEGATSLDTLPTCSTTATATLAGRDLPVPLLRGRELEVHDQLCRRVGDGRQGATDRAGGRPASLLQRGEPAVDLLLRRLRERRFRGRRGRRCPVAVDAGDSDVRRGPLPDQHRPEQSGRSQLRVHARARNARDRAGTHHAHGASAGARGPAGPLRRGPPATGVGNVGRAGPAPRRTRDRVHGR